MRGKHNNPTSLVPFGLVYTQPAHPIFIIFTCPSVVPSNRQVVCKHPFTIQRNVEHDDIPFTFPSTEAAYNAEKRWK